MKVPLLEKLWRKQHRIPEPKKEEESQGVKDTLPDGTVIWADNQEALDKLKEQHASRTT